LFFRNAIGVPASNVRPSFSVDDGISAFGNPLKKRREQGISDHRWGNAGRNIQVKYIGPARIVKPRRFARNTAWVEKELYGDLE
jgi:hypothetical protein